MTQRSLLWKNLRRKYGRPILKLSYWKSSLRSQIFLCTSTSLVFNEEGTYVESTGRRYKIPKEQYQMIWIHLKFSLKGDLEYDIASQWYISEKCFSKFLFFFLLCVLNDVSDASIQLLLCFQENLNLCIAGVLYRPGSYKMWMCYIFNMLPLGIEDAQNIIKQEENDRTKWAVDTF